MLLLSQWGIVAGDVVTPLVMYTVQQVPRTVNGQDERICALTLLCPRCYGWTSGVSSSLCFAVELILCICAFCFRRLALFRGGKKPDQLWQNAVWVFGYPTSLRRRRLAPYSTVLCKGQFQGEKNIQPLLTLPFVLTAFVTLLYASIFASVKRFALHLYKGASLPQLIA